MADDGVVAGPRILLRRPRLEDANALFARVTSDPQVTEFLAWRPHPNVGETRRVITQLFNVGDDHTWAIVMRDTDEVIGQCGYRQPQAHAVELRYCLSRQWWGMGVMSEALRVVIEMFVRDPWIYRVWAACHVDNVRSALVLERSGLALEGRMARYTVFPNLSPEPQDALLSARAMR